MLRHNPGLWECAFLFVFLLHLSQAARLFPAEAGPCFVNFQLAAQRVLTDDDVISTTLFAGHQGHELNALVLWQTPFNTSILLPPGHLLKSQEVPDNWFDGESSITGERLLFQSRGVQRQWQVSELPEPLSPTDPLGTGALNLGPSSPIWHSHAAVVFTGAQLHFLPHQTGRLCSAMSALEHVAGSTHHVRYYMNSPRQHTLRVVDRDGTQEEAGSAFFNVSLLWGADLAQSLIPIGASRLLEKYHSMQLELDNRVVLLDSYGMQQGKLAAPNVPSFSSALIHTTASQPHAIQMQQLVLGRRLLAKIATAWAVDSNGHVAVQFASAPFSAASVASDPAVPSDSIPESVLWVAMVLGLFLLYGATWWVSFLADTLRVGYRPEPGSLGSVDAEEGIVPRRKDVYVAAVSLVLIIALHALAGVYSGQGTLADASLEQSMRSFTLSYWICTIVIGALFLPVMVLELSRNTRVMRSRHRYVSLQLYAILFGALVTRGLLASLLVAAGTTFLQDFVTILMLLIFVLFPTLYATLLLSSYVFSGRRLYMPDTPATNPGRDRYGVERVLTLFSLAVMLGVSVVLGVTIPVWLISPFLQSRNGAYTNQAIIATELMTMAIPFFGISFALSESGKRLLRGAMRKIGSSIGQGKKGV